MPVIGDVIAEKYKIDKVLGEGGMGAVFAATHQITGKRVALKWMRQELANDEEAGQRFIREAQAAGRIDHPNVVDVYDVGKQGSTVFLVMEYLYGEPLTAVLERGPQNPTDVIQLLIPAMRGVAAAHQQGVVHRDLKPDNIFLCRSPEGVPREAKVLDFGISKMSGQGNQTSPRLTRTGAMMGTPYYMSPEQIRGAKEIGSQVDVYAFGVILYEALAGKVPFHADTFSALVLEIATATPVPLRKLRPDIPERLEAVVMKAMARETKDRYASIEDFGRDLGVFGDGVTFDMTSHQRPAPDFAKTSAAESQAALNVTSTPYASEVSLPPIPSKHGLPMPMMAGLGAVVVLALGGVGYFTLGGQKAPRSPSMVRPAVASPAVPKPPVLPPAVTAPEVVAKEPPMGVGLTQQKALEAADNAAQDKNDKASADAAKSDVAGAANTSARRGRAAKRPRTALARSQASGAAPAVVEQKPAPAQTSERRSRSGSGRTGGLGLEEF